MKDQAAIDKKGELPQIAPGKVANVFNKAMIPISTYIAYVGAAVLGALVLMLAYSIIARRAFGVPLKGSMELTEIALGLITFFILAYDSLHGESMVVEIIIDHFPRKIKAIIGVIIHFLSTAMVGILCWQLIVQGMRVYGFHQTTVILAIPSYPFLFIAAFGTFLLTLVYLKHFINSVDKAWKK
jgi:TRAP-type transport system small permease protein